jgi:hypothetical protein
LALCSPLSLSPRLAPLLSSISPAPTMLLSQPIAPVSPLSSEVSPRLAPLLSPLTPGLSTSDDSLLSQLAALPFCQTLPRFKYRLRRGGGESSFELVLQESRCEAKDAGGLQCSRFTRAHAPYCLQHVQEVLGLTIRESTISGAGKGLFTSRAHTAGSVLTPYTGELLTREEKDARYPDDAMAPYAVQITSQWFLDAAGQRGVGAYANGSRGDRRPNAKFVVCTKAKSAKLVALRHLRPDEEVLVSYGRAYWRDKGVWFTTEGLADDEWVVPDLVPPPSAVSSGGSSSCATSSTCSDSNGSSSSSSGGNSISNSFTR